MLQLGTSVPDIDSPPAVCDEMYSLQIWQKYFEKVYFFIFVVRGKTSNTYEVYNMTDAASSSQNYFISNVFLINYEMTSSITL